MDGEQERTPEQFNEDVREALAHMQAGPLHALSYLTGIPEEKLTELGGI